MRASAHAMDLLQTVTTGKTLGRVLNSEQFFRARVSQQSAGSSLPLLSLSLSLTSSFAPPPPSSHPATLSLLFSCKCYALSLCLSEPQAHTHTQNLTTPHPPSLRPISAPSLSCWLLLLTDSADLLQVWQPSSSCGMSHRAEFGRQ